MIDEADGVDELLLDELPVLVLTLVVPDVAVLLVGEIVVAMLSLCLLERRIAPALQRMWRCVSEAASIRRLCVGFGGGAVRATPPKPAGAYAPAVYYLLTALRQKRYCNSFRTCCGNWFACATIAWAACDRTCARDSADVSLA